MQSCTGVSKVQACMFIQWGQSMDTVLSFSAAGSSIPSCSPGMRLTLLLFAIEKNINQDGDLTPPGKIYIPSRRAWRWATSKADQ